MNTGGNESSGVIAPPPLIYAAGIVLGLALNWLAPLPLWPGGAGRALRWTAGGALFAVAALLAAWAMLRFARAGTPVPTWRPTKALVVEGPYRLTRNPIYVALGLVQAALGLSLDNAWILAALVAVLAVINFGVVAREEAYLERRFGEDYRRYRAEVRRWL
jgi:protein-S-isoprenylcysteine O-methyltransferase Ste14